MKLLRPYAGTGAIFFPEGSLEKGGTCEFATEICLKECSAVANFGIFEEYHISKRDKKSILKFIQQESLSSIAAQILKDLDGLQTTILYWFATGDCMSNNTDKIDDIICLFNAFDDIQQIGFTRNQNLWSEFYNQLCLTIDKSEHKISRAGHYAIPNYKTKEIEIVINERISYGCGGGVTKKNKFLHEANCKICLRKKVGCFYPE